MVRRYLLGPLHLHRRHGQGEGRRPERERPGRQGEWVVPYKCAQTRQGMPLIGARRGGKAHPPEAQIVPQSPGRQCVGAFAECSSDMHLLLREAARCAAMRYWRQVGAVSVEAAIATYSARYRRHWGAELALLQAGHASGSPGHTWPSRLHPAGQYDLWDLFYWL